ncbi:inactive ubiquitin carboxyl-terminal hydrolase 50 [Solea senegalensis]|uniref:Ubiquitin carboxyl-terminal hydrolase n=1 Tax=Solea senegalensis TaxID=28829 RepID=A0AAV6PKG0_SOLSE|nr:uncharacterized protein LOC122761341 [Solea senegalensis]KAG7468746.1 inactive ubiquitin carboxyl-terminal hydrolase 50 [Solea senegalensis]
MKVKALSVQECTWMSEECHPVDKLHRDTNKEGLCLPNIFKSKKVKPLSRSHSGPTYRFYYTARELLLELLDRGTVQELVRRAAGVKAGANRPLHSQSREQCTELSEEEYAEVLTWFSIVLQSGLSVGDDHSLASELSLKLDGWQGVLKRNSFQNNLLSLSRLEDGEKLEALTAFCGLLSRRYQALYTPGQNLVVKKYQLSYQQGTCPLHAALLCDVGSGFICNMYLYCPEQLQKQSRKPVIEQVVERLLRPFCNHRRLVQMDSSAWMSGRVTDIFSGFGININFVPKGQRPITDPTSPQSTPVIAHERKQACKDSLSQLVAHLQGWTGPALLPPSDLKGSVTDVFLPGFWVMLHTICINTFVLHTLQSQDSGKRVTLKDFTRTLASQMSAESSATVPVLPQLNSSSQQEERLTNLSKQRVNTVGCGQAKENERRRCSSAVRLQLWNTPGVCGLDNFGNSCYLNAVLQCLCSTVPLVEHLLNQDTRKELARSKCRMAEVFVRLLEQMWLGRSTRCAPVETRSVLCSILPQFNNYSQQDAQELLLFLLNALHDNLKKVVKRQMRQLKKDQSRICANAAGDSTIVSHLFEGQLSYTTLCTHCSHQANSTQTFTVLSLALPSDVIKCSIQDCLSLFFEQTILSGGEKMLCSVCGLRRETAVLTCLDKAPEILMLHLKRFGFKGKNHVKLRTNVVFSMKLDVNQFLSSSAQTTSCSSYRLYAVVNHAGHLNMGHYTALSHNTLTRTWHCFDDSSVREVQDSYVQSPNAYLLFYSRKPFKHPKIFGL